MSGRLTTVSFVACLLLRIDAVQVFNERQDGVLQIGGHVGCRFSNSICSDDEECVDDGLFGNCQKILLPKDTHRYKLSNGQLQELEGILQVLIRSGYTWRHWFTQCVLINTLATYRHRLQLDIKFCSKQGAMPAVEFPYLVEEPMSSGKGRKKQQSGKGWVNDDLEGVPGEWNRIDSYKKRWMIHDPGLYPTANGGGGGGGGDGGGKMAADLDSESFDDFFMNLSLEELMDLRNFLVDRENGRMTRKGRHEKPPSVGIPVKKASDMTEFVVHVNQKGPDSSAERGKEADTTKPESLISGEKMPKQMHLDEETHHRDQNYGGKEKQPAKMENPTQYGTSLTPNLLPVHQFVIPGAGSHLGVTTIIPAAIIKDIQPIKYEAVETSRMATGSRTRQYLITMYFLCGVVGVIIAAALVVYVMRRHASLKDKISKWTGSKGVDETTSEYQDLCRQHMQAKLIEKAEPVHKSSRVEMISATEQPGRTTSTGSSTSSWTEEPVSSSMDISTGHIILSYMEDHLTNKDRLQKEWDSLCAYDAEPCSIVAAIEPTNMRKNRYTDILPYEHSRVKLSPACNVSGSDYINACTITDHDPRNPAYIAAQGPLPHTVADFWQMVWEQGSVVIVNLTRLTENTIAVCHRYWPEEGSDLYHIYEVHLISEHAWCDDYLVRSFFLKNLQTNETRTITQFHFLTWPNNGIPSSTKTLLDFRRKVNKSYRGRSCPIVVHCSDGAGRTGTYSLIDMALNRLQKGAKEIDIAATLEHIRDQRINMVRTKEQFEFALAAVAEEVHAIVHVPPAQ